MREVILVAGMCGLQKISQQCTVWLPPFSPCSSYTDTFEKIAEIQSTYLLNEDTDKQAMMNLLANNTRTETDSGISICRPRYFQIQCQEMMIYTYCSSVLVCCIHCVCTRSNEFCYFLIECPLKVSFSSLACCLVLILPPCLLA